ncbi:MAG TPA: hypothetical protein VD963_08005, partial [Phycisphaerales bacterium]|nr:hypothetical protein [Phycisphaerales bacterium]
GTINAAATAQRTKDRTGDILSILIFQGSISPELCISPAESNTAGYKRDDNYQYSDPAAATTAGGQPANALWDPGFSGSAATVEPNYRRGDNGQVGGTPKVGHQSYAHNLPFGKRAAKWTNSFSATEAVFGNRGPFYTDTQYPTTGRYTLNPAGATPPGVDSNTLLIHGGRNTWEGNVAYNDNHVNFETKPNPDGLTYRRTGTAQPLSVPDNIFIDEQNEAGTGAVTDPGSRSNNFLRQIAQVTESSGVITATLFID